MSAPSGTQEPRRQPQLDPKRVSGLLLSNLLQGQCLATGRPGEAPPAPVAALASAEHERRDRRPEGVRIFPSVHTIVAASEHLPPSAQGRADARSGDFWGSEHLNRMLGGEYENAAGHARVVAVTGPATSGKSLIAGNFLLQGLASGFDVLLIRLAERPRFNPSRCYMGRRDWDGSHPKEYLPGEMRLTRLDWDNEQDRMRIRSEVKGLDDCLSMVDKSKIACRLLRNEDVATKPVLIELAMQPGALLPEEFIDIIRLVYKWEKDAARTGSGTFGIRRAALLDVGAIGVSYPLLYHSSTADELFLPSLVHMLRCRGTDLILTGQTGGIAESEEMVRRAESVANCVISCSHCDVFGDRYITVTGPGLIENDLATGRTPENVPGVLRRESEKARPRPEDIVYFDIDMTTLHGLVGFSTGHIRRPGILLQLFQEGALHGEYNQQVSRLVEFAMGNSRVAGRSAAGWASSAWESRQHGSATERSFAARGGEHDAPAVVIDTFDSVDSAPFHGSLGLLAGAPLHNTVLRTIDEYSVRELPEVRTIFREAEGTGDPTDAVQGFLYSLLYYRNVLLFACDGETYGELTTRSPGTDAGRWRGKENRAVRHVGSFWEVLERRVNPSVPDHVHFIADLRAPETFSSLAMDGILGLAGETARRKGHGGEDLDLGTLADELSAAAGGPRKSLIDYIGVLGAVLPRALPLIDPKSGRLGAETSLVLSRGRRFIVLGWYSHIREMVELFLNDPGIASPMRAARARALARMRLLPLPGGGFTGDWYLHSPEGSVSESLGNEVRRTLLDPVEDFRRFVQGVGLPCWPNPKGEFPTEPGSLPESVRALWRYARDRYGLLKEQEYLTNDRVAAWPGAPQGMTLESVLEMHRAANLRSKLVGYSQIRGELAGLMEHIRSCGSVASTGNAPVPTGANDAIAQYVLALLRSGSRMQQERERQEGRRFADWQ